MEHDNLEFVPGIGNLRRLLALPVPVVRKVKPKKASGPVKARWSKTAKLSPMQFMEALFKANELLAKAKKMTDLDMLSMWEREFNDDWVKPSEGQKKYYEFQKKRLTKLRDYRKRFNRGELYEGQIVTVVAWRYNQKGNRVDYTDGETLLTPEQEKWWINYFRGKAGSRWKVGV